jgi:hypothetical protein
MANQAVSGLGPLFGPDFVIVTVNDETKKSFQLQVYPDANNPALKANGLAQQFYFLPKELYVAKLENSPDDYDFGMTVFKGLMTTETSVGVTDANTTGGSVSMGGGYCAFSMTFAIPDSVIANAVEKLKAHDHPAPNPRIAQYFGWAQNQPDPVLGIVPILENKASVKVPSLGGVGGTKAPFFIDAQGGGVASTEAHGISSYLITCNELAAGAIVGGLQQGHSPFEVHYELKWQAYLNAVHVDVIIDVSKTFDSFSAAVSAEGFFSSANLSYAYDSCITNGSITTVMKYNSAAIPDDLKQMIEKQVDQMRQQAFDTVKSEIFDWKPAADPAATTSGGGGGGLFGSLFGFGAQVSMKAKHEVRQVKLTNSFDLDSAVAIIDGVDGTLNDLAPAVKANLDKYLAIVDIGEYFKKLQVAGTCWINWNEVLPDGTKLSDPVMSAQLEVSYPDYDTPVADDGSPNLQTQANGFHYTLGKSDPNSSGELAMWTPDNPKDVVNISYLRLDKPPKDWPADQVKLRQTIIFDGNDPRVELADGGTQFQHEFLTTEHDARITVDSVGYVFVRFMLDRILPKDNISVTITTTLGSRNDTLTITKANQKNIIWQIFSDKYFDEKQFSYTVDVEVTGPNFTDDPVQYSTPKPIVVKLPQGRVKYLNPVHIALPVPPPDKIQTVNNYIKAYTALVSA